MLEAHRSVRWTTAPRLLGAAGLIWAALWLLGAPGAVQAQQQEVDPEEWERLTAVGGIDDEQAREHFRIGQNLYDAGRFADAAREFERAFELSQRPLLLFNAYVAYRDAGDLPGAIRNLTRFLEEAPEAPNAAQLRIRLRGMQDALAEREAEEARRREAEEARAAEAQPPPAEADHGGARWLPLALLGAGGGMVIGGTVTGVLTLRRLNDIESHCPQDVCPGGYDLSSDRSSVKTLRVLTDVLLFGGGALAATGLVLWLVGGGDDEETPAAALACDPSGCAVQVRGRF